MIAGNAADVGARNAQVIELAVVESGKLADGLLVGGPFLEGLADVHRISPVVYDQRYRLGYLQ